MVVPPSRLVDSANEVHNRKTYQAAEGNNWLETAEETAVRDSPLRYYCSCLLGEYCTIRLLNDDIIRGICVPPLQYVCIVCVQLSCWYHRIIMCLFEVASIDIIIQNS